MRALADYCESAFGSSAEEMESCYKKAGELMINRIGTDTAAIHSRLLRTQCMLELLEKPLFPHAVNMYHAYWDTLIRQAQPCPGVLDFMRRIKGAWNPYRSWYRYDCVYSVQETGSRRCRTVY